ncbi:hypothetical protein F895_02253 [Acinetobacter sp. CIP 64.2]|nr:MULTISPECIES: hypothetical protein [Acinetobacter]ENX15707.1 hypothetical protein F895_02253 [Acinetobacter sp. CIP 64.2]
MNGMKLIKLVCTFLLLSLLSGTALAKQPIECLLKVKVIASQKYTSPQTEYTAIKNDGYPMLLIGIEVMDAQTMRNSQKIKAHHAYCNKLIGQQRDAYLSGPYDSNKITTKIGDQLSLRNIHSSAQEYPFWPDFYYVEP